MTTETMTHDNLLAGGKAPTLGCATLANGAGSLTRGSALGRILRSISAAVAGGGNSGNGTVTGIALRAGAQVGAYALACIGGALTATKSDPIGTGTGALTLDASPILAGAQVGVYKIVCIEPGSNVGTFAVYDPYGVYLGKHIVAGAAFATQIKFTIADDVDFVAGDYFTVTVAPAAAGNGLSTFSVTAPDGTVTTATVGTAYTGEIGFTINDGTNNFALGDTFAITVASILGDWTLANSANRDGSEVVDCILAADADATSSAVPVSVYFDGTFNEATVDFGGTDTADTHRQAMRDKGLHLVSITHG